jgi:4a-hydroxytetrahydrobiopterin dehydratase
MARLEENEIDRRLADLPEWSRSGQTITRELDCSDFAGSVELVNRLAPVAEEMNHHPDLAISWNTVDVTLSTHSEGGLTNNDFELAHQIDQLD